MNTILTERINSFDLPVECEPNIDNSDSVAQIHEPTPSDHIELDRLPVHVESAEKNFNPDTSNEKSSPDFSLSSPTRLCSSLDTSPAGSDTKVLLDDASPVLSKSTHNSPSQSKRRSRTVMTPSQTRILHAVLEETYFPSNEQREQLSKILQIPQRTIQVWFQNQRQKAKQFGKPSESSSLSGSSSSTPLRHSPGNGLPSGPQLASYSHLLPNQPFSSTTYHHATRRPILLYGAHPQHTASLHSATAENFYLPIEQSPRFPMNPDVPIRKRTFPIQTPGTWEYSGYKLNTSNNVSVDYYKSPISSLASSGEKYKNYRSSSLPTHAQYTPPTIGHYNPTHANGLGHDVDKLDASPSTVLSSLLQSTSLIKKDDTERKNDTNTKIHIAGTSPEQAQIKDLERFKDEGPVGIAVTAIGLEGLNVTYLESVYHIRYR